MSVAVSVPTVQAALADAEATLIRAGIDTPRADAEWLLAGLLGIGRAALAMNARRPLVAATAARYEDAVRRRARREPLQRILGWEAFCGLRIALTADVLIPRPETEMLVEWSLGFLPPRGAGRRLHVIDVGTGSGCIACAIAQARRDVDVTAIDLSQEAAAIAQRNVTVLGSAVRVIVGDLLSVVADATVDLVVANLPYVPDAVIDDLAPEVSAHEPRLALAGGSDGLTVIRRLVPEATRVLRTNGTLALETFGAAQARAVATMLADAGFSNVTTRADLAKVTRFVAGRLL